MSTQSTPHPRAKIPPAGRAPCELGWELRDQALIAGATVPACITGIMHQRAHERSLQAEFNWRRWYEKSLFDWNEVSLDTGLPKWNDGRWKRKPYGWRYAASTCLLSGWPWLAP